MGGERWEGERGGRGEVGEGERWEGRGGRGEVGGGEVGGERWEGGRGILVLKPSSDMPNGRCQSSFHVDIDDVMVVICLAQNVETEKLRQLYEEMLLSRLDYTPLCATAEQSVVGGEGEGKGKRGGREER